jgi:hypothetical protein
MTNGCVFYGILKILFGNGSKFTVLNLAFNHPPRTPRCRDEREIPQVLGLFRASPLSVIPAKAGTQIQENLVSESVSSISSSFFVLAVSLDPRLRGDDGGRVSVFLEQNENIDKKEFPVFSFLWKMRREIRDFIKARIEGGRFS